MRLNYSVGCKRPIVNPTAGNTHVTICLQLCLSECPGVFLAVNTSYDKPECDGRTGRRLAAFLTPPQNARGPLEEGLQLSAAYSRPCVYGAFMCKRTCARASACTPVYTIVRYTRRQPLLISHTGYGKTYGQRSGVTSSTRRSRPEASLINYVISTAREHKTRVVDVAFAVKLNYVASFRQSIGSRRLNDGVLPFCLSTFIHFPCSARTLFTHVVD